MSFQEHIARRDNPHQVTKAQVGLSEIENYPIASEAETLAMQLATRYIDRDSSTWIQAALVQYMQSIGLIDANGLLVRAPNDNQGQVTFAKLLDDSFVLNGTHPTAVTVDIELKVPESDSFYFDGLEISNTEWEVDLTEIPLDPTTAYSVVLNYRNTNEIVIGNKTIPITYAGTNQANVLLYRYYNGRGLGSGCLTGAAKVVLKLYRDDVLVTTYPELTTTGEGCWSFDLPAGAMTVPGTYVLEADSYDAANTHLNNSISAPAINAVSEAAVIFITPEAQPAQLYGYIPDADTVNAVIKLETDTIKTVTNVPVDESGYWYIDLSQNQLDSTLTYIAHVTATYQGVDLVINSKASVSQPSSSPYWMQWDETRSAWYWDMKTYAYWVAEANAEVEYVDYGRLPQ